MDFKIELGRVGIERRLRRERRRLVVREVVQDFAQDTTLHGLRYIADRRLSHTEKIFWIVSFVASLSLCTMLIWNMWVKWQTIPIIVTLSEDLVSVEQVPFPSVTICPYTKVKKSVCNDDCVEDLFYEFAKFDENDKYNDTDESRKFEAICLISNIRHIASNKFSTKIVTKIFEISLSIKDVFHSCQLHQMDVFCDELFRPVLTTEGVCFTMNSLAASEILREDSIQRNYTYLNTSAPSVGWSHSDGYSHFHSEEDVYPRRGGSGKYNLRYVRIVLKQEGDDEHGFKVYLHHPADLPQSSVFYYSVPPEQSVSLGLKLNLLNTSSSLRSYSPNRRRCYFPEERQLRYFLAYTDSNCKLECLSNYTLSRCGCVWFHMPHNETSTICSPSKRLCMLQALSSFEEREGGYNQSGRCRCYPSCLHIQYEAEVLKILKFNSIILQNVFYFSNFFNHSPKIFNYTFSRLELFHKAPQFVSMHRSELFGLTDFLANCGGLLGLFLGFSFLSLAEIAYFLTLRLGCSLRRDMQQADIKTEKNEQRH